MVESATYQALRREAREEGRAEEARRILLLQGELKFGSPDAPTRDAVEAIDDIRQLERLTARLLDAGSWEELLPLQGQRRRNGRRRSQGSAGAFAHAPFVRVLGMEESATYQAIVRRGREEQARRMLLLLGQTKFGSPDSVVRTAIERTSDVARLEELTVRLLSADSWYELFEHSTGRQRSGRRRARE